MTDLLLRSSALFVLAAVVAVVLRRRAAASRHLLWALAIVGVVALPLAQWLLPARWEILPRWDAPVAPVAATPPQRTAVSPTAPVEVAQAPVDDPLATTQLPADQTAQPEPMNLATIVRGTYALGVALMLAWLAAGVLIVRRRVSRARVLDDPDWDALLEDVSADLALARVPQLKSSDEVPLPFTAGVFSPVIVLPTYADAWTATKRRAVLLHEAAHISRGDITMNLLSYLVRAIYWINPLAWVATRRLRVEGEKACDDVVLAAGARASDYAEHLLQIVQRDGAPMPSVALAMARGSDFEGRLISILSPDAPRGRLTRRRTLTAAGLAAMAVVTIAAVSPASPSPAAAMLPAEMHDSTFAAHEAPEVERPQVQPQSQERRASPVTARAEVAALLSVLNDSSAAVRLAAVTSLGALDDTVAVTALSRALREDTDPRVREAAANALQELQDPRAVPALIEALRAERSVKVKVSIINALDELDDPRAVAALLPQLKDASPTIRRSTVSALQGFPDASILPALEVLVRDPDVEVRRHVASALGEIEDTDAMETLITLTRDADAEVRAHAISGLSDFDDPRKVAPLTAALSDANAEVRQHAASALGSIDGMTTAPRALVDLLSDPNREVRREAANALGQIGDEKAVPALRRLLTDQDVETRRRVVEALKDIGGADAIQSLLTLMKDPDPEIRKTVAEALGKRREQ